MKKILFLFIAIISLAGCQFPVGPTNPNTQPSEPRQLKTPVITIDYDGNASFMVENAISYQCVLNNDIEVNIKNSTMKLTEGDSLKVKALGDSIKFLDSEYSEIAIYEKNGMPIKLATPVITINQEGMAQFNVSNAVSYCYILNDGTEVMTTDAYLILNDGDTLKVKALGDGIKFIDSEYSLLVTYQKKGDTNDGSVEFPWI